MRPLSTDPVSSQQVRDSAPPSLHWVPAVRFPSFNGTMERSDSLRTVSPRFVCASLGDTIPCACVRLSDRVRRRPGAGDFTVWQSHASVVEMEPQGLPSSRGTLMCL